MSMNRARRFLLLAATSAAVGGGVPSFPCGRAAAQSPPPATRPAEGRQIEGRRPPKSQALSGTVEGYNLSPNGTYDGILLKDGGRTMQVNIPPHAAGALTRVAPVGGQVKVEAVPQLSMPDHPVYNLLRLEGADGQEIKGPRPDERGMSHAEGAVKQLNYDRQGQVNGVLLEGGEFVLIGPDAANMDLAAGKKLTTEGRPIPSATGRSALLAATVNGTPVRRPPPGEPGPGGTQRDGFRTDRARHDGARPEGRPRHGDPRISVPRDGGPRDRGPRDGDRRDGDRRDGFRPDGIPRDGLPRDGDRPEGRPFAPRDGFNPRREGDRAGFRPDNFRPDGPPRDGDRRAPKPSDDPRDRPNRDEPTRRPAPGSPPPAPEPEGAAPQ